MRGRCVAATFMVGALLFVACGGDDSTTSSTTTSVKEPTTKCGDCPTYGASDTAIAASVGDRFVVALESNPSTGYQWTATSSDAGVVELVGDEYVRPDTTLVGAPGTKRFFFDAVAVGTATLQLRYARSFQPDDPDARELTYTVTVT
jgi:predicted secreted protein